MIVEIKNEAVQNWVNNSLTKVSTEQVREVLATELNVTNSDSQFPVVSDTMYRISDVAVARWASLNFILFEECSLVVFATNALDVVFGIDNVTYDGLEEALEELYNNYVTSVKVI